MDSIIKEKSYTLALTIIKLYRTLIKDRHDVVIAKQLVRSGTSIGANIEEALGGQSPRDFRSKMAIAYKEARETMYWLRLLRDADMIEHIQFSRIEPMLEEVLKILAKIQQTMKSRKY